MGGDHKCPVCQATFTRPQHVARHMRSHTGDRPYKCQHCGDQFARSDLLSRHVNKCHANEKPPPNTGNTRRKGSASASRAITSKQACDQCVQSSLPCDGCNPCAKCVQRKCRCTFVKFHRQTAPVGPGHNPRPSSSSARLPGYGSSDDFLLVAPQLGVGPTIPDIPYAQQFSFHPPYPDSRDPSIPQTATDTCDFAQRFRAQAELLRRESIDNSGNIGPALYNDPSWLGWPQQNSPEPNFAQNDIHNPSLETRCLSDDPRQFTLDKALQTTLSRHIMDQRDQQYPGQPLRSPHFSLAGADALMKGRRGSLDFSSDSSHPSSATSSNVHLPLDVPSVHMSYHVGLGEHQRMQQLISNLGQDVSGQNPYPPVMNHSSHQGPQPGEGGFSSAFGLMSLDDPNVIAGLSNDGVPYFSTNMSMYAEDPNATPMPTKQGTNQRANTFGPNTSSLREAETRELREFWKTYMRTPLSGPSSALEVNAQAGTHQRRPSTPSRRVRVNSLPSAKTPTAEGTKPYYPNGTNNGTGTNATSSMRTTLHGNVDDLRSYEAAVLARKAPMLHLAPRRRGNAAVNQQINNISGVPTQGVGADFNRPSSASSLSSLADAFGKSEEHGHHAALGGGENMSTRRSPPSRESSLSLTGEESASDVDAFRPSFKRLPSQTLGPAKSKRALLSLHGGVGDGEGRVIEGSGGDVAMGGGHHSGNGNTGKGLHQQRHALPLSDRHRRLSPPGGTLVAPILSSGQGIVES